MGGERHHGVVREEWAVRVLRLDRQAIGQHLVYDLVDGEGRVLLGAGARITERYLELLQARGYLSVPVDDPVVKDVVVREPLPERVRTRVTDLVADSIRRAEDGTVAVTPALRAAVDDVLEALQRTAALTYNLLSLHSLDTYFFVHGVNVCIYSLLIGNALALDTVDKRHLGIGAILHDIGMIYYRELLERPGALTPGEHAQIRQHTEAGYELLRRQREVDLRSAHVAFQHHERLDGSGYPRGLSSEKISPWAKVVAIAEVFDSVTSSRNYAASMCTAEALDLLETDARAGRLDGYFVRYFVQRMSRYPAGTIVRMAAGTVGAVIRGDVPGQAFAEVRIISADGVSLLPTPTPVTADGSAPDSTVDTVLHDYPEALHAEIQAVFGGGG